MQNDINNTDFTRIANEIKQLGKDCGFDAIGIADVSQITETEHMQSWLEQHFHGEMRYLERHQVERLNPAILVPGAKSVICCRAHYTPPISNDESVASFALTTDYTELLHARLEIYVKKILNKIKDLEILRIFSGCTPLLEKALAVKSGLGWQGKNSLVMHPSAGSYFFLGEIFINLALPNDLPINDQCGSCTQCLQHCPTQAIVAPYLLNASRCISYLTGQYRGSIPLELRPLMGTKIFGCDHCQCVCPWNESAATTDSLFTPVFQPQNFTLAEMFLWDEATMCQHTDATPIKRLSFEFWLRNLAVALGNSSTNSENVKALQMRRDYPSELVKEHVEWALGCHVPS